MDGMIKRDIRTPQTVYHSLHTYFTHAAVPHAAVSHAADAADGTVNSKLQNTGAGSRFAL